MASTKRLLNYNKLKSIALWFTHNGKGQYGLNLSSNPTHPLRLIYIACRADYPRLSLPINNFVRTPFLTAKQNFVAQTLLKLYQLVA